MLKVLLVYFSGTGITRYYASLIREEMLKRGYSCGCLDLEELVDLPALWQKKPVALGYTIRAENRHPLSKYPWPYTTLKQALQTARADPRLEHLTREWNDYDLIGFGSPVYAFRPAPVVIRFLLDLPRFDRALKVFSFATHDGAQGDFESFMKSVLDGKGFNYVGHLDQSFIYSASFVMRRHLNHLKASRLLSAKSRWAAEKINIFLDYVESLAADISYRYPGPAGMGKLLGLPYRLIYSYGIDILLNHFLFGFGIHREGCIQCMTCVNQCPQGLMEIDDEGYPVRHYHCMYCLRCLNWCPTDALYFSSATEGKARFPGLETLLETAAGENLDRVFRKAR